MEKEAIDTPQLLEELAHLRQQVADLKAEKEKYQQQAKQAKAKEETFRRMLNTPTDYWLLLDPNGLICDLNETVVGHFGQSREELLGSCVYDIFPPEIAQNRKQQVEHVAQSGQAMRVTDQRLGIWFDMVLSPAAWRDGEVSQVAILARDVTEQKQVETALQDKEKKLNQAQRIARLGYWHYDLRTNQGDWSEEAYRIFGISPDEFEVTVDNVRTLFHPEDLEKSWQAFNQTLTTGAPYDMKYRIIRPDGMIRHLHSQAEVIYDETGQPSHIFGILLDITELKRAEAALRESERKLAKAQQIAHLGYWEYDIQKDQVNWSDEKYRIFGLEEQTEIASLETVLARFHPDDLEEIQKKIDETLATGKPYDIEHRIVRPDGTIRLVHFYGELSYDEEDRPRSMFGTALDTTELRQLEQAYETLVHSSLQGLALLSEEGVILANEALCQIFGYTPTELQAMPFSELYQLFFAEERPEIIGAVESWLAGHPLAARQEMRVRRRDGTTRWIEQRGVDIRYNGKPARQITVLDITDRKQAEQKLERYNRELIRLNQVTQTLNTSLDMEETLTHIVEGVHRLLKGQGCSLWLPDPETGEMVCRRAITPHAEWFSGWRLKPGQGIVGWVSQHNQSLIVADTRTDARHLKDIDRQTGIEIRAILSIPLPVEGAIGVIQAVNETASFFDTDHLRLVEPLATAASIALQNVHLYEMARQVDHLRRLNDLDEALSAILEPKTVARIILEQASSGLESPLAAVALFPDREEARPDCFLTLTDDWQEDPTGRFRRWLNDSSLSFLPAETCAFLIGYSDTPLTNGADGLLAPIVEAENRVAALLLSGRPLSRPFTGEDKKMTLAMVSRAAQAFQNGRLYQTLQDRAQELETLNQIGLSLTSTLNDKKIIELALSLIGALYKTDEINYYQDYAQKQKRPPDQDIREWIFQQQQPVLIPDIAADDRTRQIMPEGGSLMSAPLFFTEQAPAILEVRAGRVQAYNHKDIRILQAVASILQIALENAHLYAEQKKLRRQQEQAQAALVQSEKMVALGELIAHIAHEISNPLQGIVTFVDLAQQELAHQVRLEKLTYYMDKANQESDRAMYMLERLRSFYKPSSPIIKKFDLHATLDSVLELLQKQFQEKQITVNRFWDEELPEMEGMVDELRQVFFNLSRNAIEAMPEGGIFALQTTYLPVAPSTEAGPSYPAVRIEFNDTGQGMDAETQKRLFEPFFTTKERGSGQGLAISYNIIQAHKGQVSVVSKPHLGTTFIILLPLKSALKRAEGGGG